MRDITTKIQNMQTKRQTKKQILNEISKFDLDRELTNSNIGKTKV